jgi:hypothetical protein
LIWGFRENKEKITSNLILAPLSENSKVQLYFGGWGDPNSNALQLIGSFWVRIPHQLSRGLSALHWSSFNHIVRMKEDIIPSVT